MAPNSFLRPVHITCKAEYDPLSGYLKGCPLCSALQPLSSAKGGLHLRQGLFLCGAAASVELPSLGGPPGSGSARLLKACEDGAIYGQLILLPPFITVCHTSLFSPGFAPSLAVTLYVE